jgi:hypothetical protein
MHWRRALPQARRGALSGLSGSIPVRAFALGTHPRLLGLVGRSLARRLIKPARDPFVFASEAAVAPRRHFD